MKESEPSSWLAMRIGGNRSEGKQAVNGDGKRARSPLFPVNLETRWTSDLESKLKRPAMSEPPANKRSYEQIRVSTEEGKRVLPSDIRLHLDKLRRAASQQAAAMESKRLEMARLEEEREQLQRQIAMRKEIKQLQEELQQEDDIAGCHLELYKPALSTPQSRQPIGHRLGNRVNEWEEHDGESLVGRRDRVEKEKVYSEEDDDNDWRNTVKRLQKDINLCKNFVSSQTKGKVHVESPLSEEIEGTIIDRRLKIPSMDQFDGTTDPHDFLNVFDGRMSFYGHSEIARCQFFYTCLQGTALKWFNNLPSRSISSCSLKEKFCLRFSSNLRGGKITASLMKVRQDHNESLRNFLVRFRAEVAEIPNLVEELAINYLAAGVDKSRHGSMLEEFFDKNPRTLQAGFQILEHRLTLQEAVGSMHSTVATKNDYKKQDDSVKLQGQVARTWQRGRSDNDYTKLNTDRSSKLDKLLQWKARG